MAMAGATLAEGLWTLLIILAVVLCMLLPIQALPSETPRDVSLAVPSYAFAMLCLNLKQVVLLSGS